MRQSRLHQPQPAPKGVHTARKQGIRSVGVYAIAGWWRTAP